MAEALAAIGVVASVAQLADFGFKLSLKLYTFSSIVSTAEPSVRALSSDVSLTSTVLKELCLIIKSDETSHVVSPTAIDATARTVRDCLTVFEELDGTLEKSLRGMGEGGGKSVREKLKWPFKQPKMELLRSNLDRLKASLTLMLQVLSYARDVSNRKISESSLEYQKHLVESLARSERAMNRKYVTMQKSLEFKTTDRGFDTLINTSVHWTSNIEPTRNGSSKENKAKTIARGFSADPEPNKTSARTASAPPPVKPRTLIGELILCFQLLNDILSYHIAVSKLGDLAALNYDDLRTALRHIQQGEMKKLEVEHADAPIYVKAEAAKNLQVRLGELAKVGYLMKRVVEKDDIWPAKLRTDSEISVAPAYNADITSQAESLDFASFTGPLQSLDPHDPSIPTQRTIEIQTQIDTTAAVMRENISKVSQRGERLDTIGDNAIALSSANIEIGKAITRARRRRTLWGSAFQGLADIGNGGFKAAQGLGSAIKDARERIFTEKHGGDDEEAVGIPVKIVGGRFKEVGDEEYENDKVGEDVLAELLGQWTNLTAEQRGIENEV